jgi:hypothetical protein
MYSPPGSQLPLLSAASEAAIIRDILGLRKRIEYSPEEMERRLKMT